IDIEHSHSQVYFGPDGIQVDIEGILCDAELCDTNGQDPALAPNEQGQRGLHRGDLQGSRLGETVIRLKMAAIGVDDRLQRGQLWQDTRLYRGGVGDFQLIRGVNFSLQLDRLDGWSC